METSRNQKPAWKKIVEINSDIRYFKRKLESVKANLEKLEQQKKAYEREVQP